MRLGFLDYTIKMQMWEGSGGVWYINYGIHTFMYVVRRRRSDKVHSFLQHYGRGQLMGSVSPS